jgi:ketosteroid isomerase-like protein
MALRLPFALRLAPFALLAACQQAPAPAGPVGLTDADRATIDSLHNAFAAAAVAGNFDAVSAMYTEDAKLLGPNMPVATGRIAIKGVLSAFPPIGEMKLIGHETHGSGDLAAVRGTYTMLMAPPGAPAVPTPASSSSCGGSGPTARG